MSLLSIDSACMSHATTLYPRDRPLIPKSLFIKRSFCENPPVLYTMGWRVIPFGDSRSPKTQNLDLLGESDGVCDGVCVP
jgi:hypothetical protein